jgi:hypothetical protein
MHTPLKNPFQIVICTNIHNFQILANLATLFIIMAHNKNHQNFVWNSAQNVTLATNKDAILLTSVQHLLTCIIETQ